MHNVDWNSVGLITEVVMVLNSAIEKLGLGVPTAARSSARSVWATLKTAHMPERRIWTLAFSGYVAFSHFWGFPLRLDPMSEVS